jgi:zinc protease
MSKKVLSKKSKPISGYTLARSLGEVEEYVLKGNGLRILYLHRPDTGTVTTNITYLVGSRDEIAGETGLAHMLEHMLFKPTAYDKKHRVLEGSAMHFERSTGSILNANTWKDRTTYYFSTPVEYLPETLRIEADRMNNIILTDAVLKPEQGNVLSEFDMYNGDPHFALAVAMGGTAIQAHPYGHETIGYREDIEDYTAEKLQRFYKNYYRPDNAVVMVVGDIDRATALTEIKKQFSPIQNPMSPVPRITAREPKQEGLRRIFVERPSTLSLVAIGFKHVGFPAKKWFTTNIMLQVLAGGPESILHKLLVDTGKVADIASSLEPTSDPNLAHITLTLSPAEKPSEIEQETLQKICTLTTKDIDKLVKKCKAGTITSELFTRTDSLGIVGELTEYVAADALEIYTETAQILSEITTKDVLELLQESFTEHNLTIGHFVGK